jgi:SAM-dependent methyltransferase
MASPTRWQTEGGPDRSQWYVDHFRSLAADGADLVGEARFMDALLPPGSRVLDAGCGPGRVAAGLYERGHTVVGVDLDQTLIEAAVEDHPGPAFLVADLATLDLADQGISEPFGGAVLAGNVMAYVAPGTETSVLRSVARHVEPGGPVVTGFGLDKGYPIAEFDRAVTAAGLALEQRFATWDLRPWRPDSDYAVSVLRVPQGA